MLCGVPVRLTGRIAFSWLSLFLCLGVGAVSLRAAPAFGPKFQWFDEHKDNFEIVFIGSSRIAHGISPKLFDEIAAEQGGPHWRSFNLGKDKMKQRECLALARHVGSLHPRQLRYLFFELQTTAADGAGAWLGNHGGRGAGGLGPDGDGYFPIDRSMSEQMRPRYQQLLQAEKAHPPTRMASPAVRDELSQLRQDLKSQGIEVVFVVAPSLRAAHGAGVNAPPGSLVFSFDDLARYAALYAEANRPDAEHLNARGAAIFTRLLATEFVQARAAGSR